MMKNGRPIILLAVFLILASLVRATDISDCTNISSPGSYSLTADILSSPATNCMWITSNDVLLDCQNHLIQGLSAHQTSGILINSSVPSNITVENCVSNNWGDGVLLLSDNNLLFNIIADSNIGYPPIPSGIDVFSNNNTLINIVTDNNTPDGIDIAGNGNTLYNVITDNNHFFGLGLIYTAANSNSFTNIEANGNGDTGINVDSETYNSFTNITTENNTYYGFSLVDSSQNNVSNIYTKNNGLVDLDMFSSGSNIDNIIHSSLFNGSVIAFDGTVDNNSWNTSSLLGGGNYWVPYSDNCPDTNHDGFCDQPFDVYNNGACTIGVNCSGNTDYLPLTDVTCGLRGLNITTFDELTNQQIYFNAYITNGTSTMTVNNIWQFNETDCNASLPTGNVTVAISNASYYSPRNYIGYIGLATLQAYLLPLNDPNAVLATFIVQDASTSPMQGIPNALVEVYKDYNGWPVLMASKYTDGIGSVSMYLDSRTQYIANASAVGYFPKSVAAAFSNSSSVIYIYLNRLSYGMGFPNPYSDVTWTLLPANHDLYQDQNSTDFIFTINSKNGTLTNYGMNITNSSGSLLSTGSGSSANGSTLSSIINQSANSGYLNVTIWFLSPSFASTPFVQTVQYIIYSNSNGLGQQILGPNGLIATSGMSIFAMGLLALIISLAITGAFSTIGFSIGKGGVIFTAAMTIFAGLGFLTPGLWIELIMIQVSFVIIRWL